MNGNHTSPSATGRKPGPGLLEASLWVAGCHLVQFVVFLALATLLLWCATPRFPPSASELVRIMDELEWESTFFFTGATTLAALLVIAPLVRMRIGRQFRQVIGFRRISAPELLLIAAAVAPLGVLSDQLYRWGLQLNALFVEWIPELAFVARFDVMQVVRDQAATTGYPILLVALALAPAIAEELVFRGLIGRGLIARWGATCGIVLTTLMFAAAHGTPAHALATIPVGLCLHLLYCMTGSLWAPIMLHALNNALAVTLLKLNSGPALSANPALIFASVGYLGVVGVLMYRSTGRETGYESARRLETSAAFPLLATCSIVAYTCVFIGTQMGTL